MVDQNHAASVVEMQRRMTPLVEALEGQRWEEAAQLCHEIETHAMAVRHIATWKVVGLLSGRTAERSASATEAT